MEPRHDRREGSDLPRALRRYVYVSVFKSAEPRALRGSHAQPGQPQHLWSDYSLGRGLHDHPALYAATTGIRRAIPFLASETRGSTKRLGAIAWSVPRHPSSREPMKESCVAS